MEPSMPFTEKYRPKTLNDILSQSSNIKILYECMKNERLPHMLFYGPSGTGKTSSIMALCKEYFGEHYKSMILELNGSDDRGINVIRTQIKNFAKVKNLFCGCNDKPKIVILDEADSLTIDAQFALRRVIEKYTSNVRFCLICNYINRVIPAVQSRCMIFKFPKLKMENMIERIEEILSNENLVMKKDSIMNICRFAQGDFRKILNFIQQKLFNDNFIILYFFRMSLVDYKTCINLLCEKVSFKKTLSKLQEVILNSNIKFDDLLNCFTYIGFLEKDYDFLYNLSELEFNFYSSNNSLSEIFVICLANVISNK